MKKNILYICPSSGIGGAETFLRATAKYTNSQEFQNTYLLFGDGPLREKLESHGAHIQILETRPRLSKVCSHIKVSREIKKIIHDRDIHLVHSTMAYGALFGARPTKAKGRIHTWFQHGPASGWMDQLASVLPHQALYSNSTYTTQKQKALEKKWAVFVPKKRKIYQIHLGTDDPKATMVNKKKLKAALVREHQWPESSILVSMLCRIQSWKGVHLFIQAIEILKNAHGETPFQALVWGDAFKGDSYFQDLKNQVQQKKLPVYFMGSTDEPQKALLASDILVNASIQPEPFGLSIIEAMACKTAVVVPNEGGPIDIINHGVNGLTFAARDAKALAQALASLIDPRRMQEIQLQGHKKFLKEFTAPKMVVQLEGFYSELIGSPI